MFISEVRAPCYAEHVGFRFSESAHDKLLAYLRKTNPELTSEDLLLIQAEPRVWTDSSCGCPKPGECYLFVLTDGFYYEFQVGEQIYRIHTNQSGSLVRSPDFLFDE